MYKIHKKFKFMKYFLIFESNDLPSTASAFNILELFLYVDTPSKPAINWSNVSPVGGGVGDLARCGVSVRESCIIFSINYFKVEHSFITMIYSNEYHLYLLLFISVRLSYWNIYLYLYLLQRSDLITNRSTNK